MSSYSYKPKIDLEMSFATGECVMQYIESLLKKLWVSLLESNDLPDRFPRLTYHDAMSKYGSDKPDLRLGMEVRTGLTVYVLDAVH